MDSQIPIGNAVHKVNAYSIRPDNPFIFNSRILSPDYVDLSFLYPDSKNIAWLGRSC